MEYKKVNTSAVGGNIQPCFAPKTDPANRFEGLPRHTTNMRVFERRAICLRGDGNHKNRNAKTSSKFMGPNYVDDPRTITPTNASRSSFVRRRQRRRIHFRTKDHRSNQAHLPETLNFRTCEGSKAYNTCGTSSQNFRQDRGSDTDPTSTPNFQRSDPAVNSPNAKRYAGSARRLQNGFQSGRSFKNAAQRCYYPSAGPGCYPLGPTYEDYPSAAVSAGLFHGDRGRIYGINLQTLEESPINPTFQSSYYGGSDQFSAGPFGQGILIPQPQTWRSACHDGRSGTQQPHYGGCNPAIKAQTDGNVAPVFRGDGNYCLGARHTAEHQDTLTSKVPLGFGIKRPSIERLGVHWEPAMQDALWNLKLVWSRLHRKTIRPTSDMII